MSSSKRPSTQRRRSFFPLIFKARVNSHYLSMRIPSSTASSLPISFPKNPGLKQKWIAVTGRINWIPDKTSCICSKHFTDDDFITPYCKHLKSFALPHIDICKQSTFGTKPESVNIFYGPRMKCKLNRDDTESNAKRIRRDDKPCSSSSDHTHNVTTVQVCRICLVTDTKMFAMNSSHNEFYENITGSTVSEARLPKYVCWECRYYMTKYSAFKSKAMMSQRILTHLLDNEKKITKKIIKAINREPYKLKSTLMQTELLYWHNNLKDSDTSEELTGLKGEKDDKSKIDIRSEMDDDDDNEIEIDDKDDIADKTSDMTNKSEMENKDDENHVEDIIYVIEIKPDDDAPLLQDKIESQSYIERIILNNCNEKVNNVDESDGKHEQSNTPAVKNIIFDDNKQSNILTVSNINLDDKEESNNPEVKNITLNDKTGLSKIILDERIITVNVLSKEEQIAVMQKRGESKIYLQSPFKCEKCFKGFTDGAAFNRHITRHSDSSGALECPLCKMRYGTEVTLKKHMRDSHWYKLTCKHCDFSAGSFSNAKAHQDAHLGKQHTCPHCSKVYNHATSYQTHLSTQHPSDSATCALCGRSFLTQKGLERHQQYAHQVDQKQVPAGGPRCARCDIRFATQEALDNHVKVSAKHAADRPEVMKEVKKNRTRKRVPPASDRPRPCEQCDEVLPTRWAYNLHFRKKHRDKNRTLFYVPKKPKSQYVMCEVCGRMFQTPHDLCAHQYIHTGTKQFKCDRCGKLFAVEKNLRYHQRSFCGVRGEFPCSECGKVLSCRSNLMKHMQIHAGESYECEVCHKAFNSRANRKRHIDFVHNKRPWPKRNRGPRKRPQPQPQSEAVLKSNTQEETDKQIEEDGEKKSSRP